MASSTTIRSLLLRLPKPAVVPRATPRRYYSTVGSSSGHRTDTAAADALSSCSIAEFQGPVGRFVNSLKISNVMISDTIYPHTPTRNLRWSLNLMNTAHTPPGRKPLRRFIKTSLRGSGWDVTETAQTLLIYRDMRKLKQDVKVWVEEGTKLTEYEDVWVENGKIVSEEGPKVLGYLLERDVFGIELSRTVYLNPSVTPFMKPEELKRSESTEMPYPCLSSSNMKEKRDLKARIVLNCTPRGLDFQVMSIRRTISR
uniref:uncharacterized protein LOC122588467 n=1 Tax=Erigeron canadensis TaxID=72917 RepID=UPI001CB96222|nr:uncharacterized protein LOC122588467 [Erigeron canadensis]